MGLTSRRYRCSAFFECQSLGTAALDIHAPHHFIFGASRPIFGVAFGVKGFGVGRPSGLADDGLPGAGRGFDDCGHLKDSKGVQAKPHCT